MRILIVDDDLLVVDSICTAIEQFGHTAVGVTSGFDALDRFDRGDRYDLVVVDVVMPGMSGLDVMDRLRTMAPGARIVALTGTGLDFTDVLPIDIRLVHKPIGSADSIVDLIAAH